MIEKHISLNLPTPWNGEVFEIHQLAPINFLVGPNGSGKSQFARAIRDHLQNPRLLGTDRLVMMEQTNTLRNSFGDTFSQGIGKNHFQYVKAAAQEGGGLETLILLEERMDLRIQVEATLSHLFDRLLSLEWDSGNLVARASRGIGGAQYRLDREECHGIKELLILLTHLYNDQHPYLIIDEPELNLHPQYQAFFMQEVRKVAGDPNTPGKKVVFLITHSPFILDFQSVDDLKAVISFDLAYSVPKQLGVRDQAMGARIGSLVPRLNVHHKQFFFADDPVFVEGVLDARFLSALQNARGFSSASAGSCIIEAGGCEEVNYYLELCSAFGKRAHFLYDLDSLFAGNLRACIRGDGTVQNFLASAGVGDDFVKYCGELDRSLISLIDELLGARGCNTMPEDIQGLGAFLKSLSDKERKDWPKEALAKARVAVLTGISRFRAAMVELLTEKAVASAEGRLDKIAEALSQKNIHLLTGGTLERYLPSYTGNPYALNDSSKNAAVDQEILYLAGKASEADLKVRYGRLYELVAKLPAKEPVDVEPVLRQYLGRYIHELQTAIVRNESWDISKVLDYLSRTQPDAAKVFTLTSLGRYPPGGFEAVVDIVDMLGQGVRRVVVNRSTNAGVGDFKIELIQVAEKV